MALTPTEQIAQRMIDGLHEAIKSAWQQGYETAQKDISGEIRATLHGNTVYEEQIIDRCAQIANGEAL